MASAKPDPRASPSYEQGAGRVDVARAITQQVTTDPASVGFGSSSGRTPTTSPITRTVTYRNAGTAPVTLTLTVAPAAGRHVHRSPRPRSPSRPAAAPRPRSPRTPG